MCFLLLNKSILCSQSLNQSVEVESAIEPLSVTIYAPSVIKRRHTNMNWSDLYDRSMASVGSVIKQAHRSNLSIIHTHFLSSNKSISVWIGHRADSYPFVLSVIKWEHLSTNCSSKHSYLRVYVLCHQTKALSALSHRMGVLKYSCVIEQECWSESAIERIITYSLRAFLSENESIKVQCYTYNLQGFSHTYNLWGFIHTHDLWGFSHWMKLQIRISHQTDFCEWSTASASTLYMMLHNERACW